MGESLDGESLGKRIRRLREAAGLRQEDLAALTGLSKIGIDQLEREKRTDPKLSTVLVLAKVFGLPVDEFVEGIGESRIQALRDRPVVRALNSDGSIRGGAMAARLTVNQQFVRKCIGKRPFREAA